MSTASPANLSGPVNRLKMGEKLATIFLRTSFLVSLLFKFWGKSHKELRVDTQFVRFCGIEKLRPMSFNDIQRDEKEPKMLTKRQV
jgi:hypothetical protein